MAPGLSRLPTAPSTMTITVNRTGYTSEIFQDLVSAFNALQEGKVSVLPQVCLIEPVEPDHSTYITIGEQTGGAACSATHVDGRVKGRVPPLHNSFSSHQESCTVSGSSSPSLAPTWHACAGQCVLRTSHPVSR